MKSKHSHSNKIILHIILYLFILGIPLNAMAQTSSMPSRRPISTTSPAWIVHIDTWVWPDPQKCIELIPEDIRPYVIFNISLSVSDFVRGKYPYSIAESWLRSCAESGVWAMIQPASGGPNNFSNTDLEVYEYFYKYPNFLGWNFCEQNWGYDTFQDYLTRLQLFVELLQMADRYGGYLIVSNFLSNPMGIYNGVGKLKSHLAYEEACKTYQDRYIICDKYTSEDAFYENESTNLGPFLSGYAGHYGIRYDLCGFGKRAAAGREYPDAIGAIPVAEHLMMTGATVNDGPELTWQIAILSDGTYRTTDGYTAKKWKMHPQFTNINVDMFRKVLDGTIRIPDKEEVIEETKVAYVCDVNTGQGVYSGYPSLYTGLYAMDGEVSGNTTWFKKTGRYPTIPVMHKEGEYETGDFQTIIRSSEYQAKWSNASTKVDAMNALFPEEYTGDMYARRMKNRWLTYHTDMDNNTPRSALIPFKYNTCDSIRISHSWFSMGIITETAEQLKIYLNNYCDKEVYGMREDVIQIYGSSTQPTWSHEYRGDRNECTVTPSWDGTKKVLTLTVNHNGPLDITINCSGTAQREPLEIPTVRMVEPQAPPIYTGPLQYEVENFHYKNINSASQTSLTDYTAMGYVIFGTSSSASVRDTVKVPRTGLYKLDTRYTTSSSGNVTHVDLYVNNRKVATPTFVKTATTSSWSINTQYIALNAGKNVIEFRANKTGTTLILDNIVLSQGNEGDVYHFQGDEASTTASKPELITLQSGTLGVVANDGDNSLKAYSTGTVNATGVADLDLFPASAVDYSVVWKEYAGTTGAKKGILMRGNGSSSYAQGMKQGYLFVTENNTDGKVTMKSYVVSETGMTEQKSYQPTFNLTSQQPCWYRASAIGDKLTFECSVDSITWQGAGTTTFTNAAYTTGSTQLVWGLGSGSLDWLMDNISYLSGSFAVSCTSLAEFNYEHTSGPSKVQTFTVLGNSLLGNIDIACTSDFEVSLNETSGYASALTITADKGNISSTTIYVRMKEGLDIGRYNGMITVTAPGLNDRTIDFTGEVFGKPVTQIYDFTNDTPSRNATNPPAQNITVAQGNSATARVMAYTDADNVKSNVFKVMGSGQRNATGVMNLNLFSQKATNYSVTWKQYIGTATNDYKIGMLLRGDPEQIGDANNGYVQGMMHGYLFIAYNVGSQGRSEFRIYKSTSTYNSVNMLVNAEVKSLAPTANKPVWYRATVSGWASVSLTLEYSLDGGTTWITAATAVDDADTFTAGATQFVWGLGSDKIDFYIDDIIFNGIVDGSSNIHTTANTEAEVVAEEYYTLMGYRVNNPMNTNQPGIYIIKSIMSDGTTNSRKVIIK